MISASYAGGLDPSWLCADYMGSVDDIGTLKEKQFDIQYWGYNQTFAALKTKNLLEDTIMLGYIHDMSLLLFRTIKQICNLDGKGKVACVSN